MSETTFSNLTPIFFLQTFVLELVHASEQQGEQQCEQLIEHIARTAGCFFEETFRDENKLQGPLHRESYIDLILGLKNNIGGQFSLAASSEDCITVVNSRCPFGEGVSNFPELCRMTSSVFGGIAARSFGYAKVEIKKSIARQDGGCEVCIYTNTDAARHKPGLEYSPVPLQKKLAMDDLQSRIEERMYKIWQRRGKLAGKKIQPPVIIAKSPAMQKILQDIEVISPTVATVLINGPTGAGKELVAKAIHAMSERCTKPYLAINCGAIPESLIETALFGHEKGAFTGAVEVHQGFFERAQGGTLFLDEVDALSEAAQTRLLRVLQEGELERVGGKQTLQVDVRIVSATNQDLERLVQQGEFRSDLYYRINVISLVIPPLAERPEDLPYLVHLILQRLNKKHNKQVSSVSREVMQRIRDYSWPGNVRELENALERSLLFATEEQLTMLDLGRAGGGKFRQELDSDWKTLRERVLDSVERQYLENSLKRYQGDVRKVADAMGISTRAVYSKVKKHCIQLPQFR